MRFFVTEKIIDSSLYHTSSSVSPRMNLSQQLLLIYFFVSSTVVANVSAKENLRHPLVATDSIVVTSDADADADGGDEDKNVVANHIAAMAASTIFDGVELACIQKMQKCSAVGGARCCSGESIFLTSLNFMPHLIIYQVISSPTLVLFTLCVFIAWISHRPEMFSI